MTTEEQRRERFHSAAREARAAQRRDAMLAMRTLARLAQAAGLTDRGDVIEDVAAWEVGDDA